MIVFTSVKRDRYELVAGDTFNLTVSDKFHGKTVISEKITKNFFVDFVASYRFAGQDGTVISPHLCGIFGQSDNLPSEFAGAVMFDDLTQEQKRNFANSCGTKIDGVFHV